MLLNNYRQYKRTQFTGNGHTCVNTSGSSFSATSSDYQRMYGEIGYAMRKALSGVPTNTGNGNAGVVFGTGTTPPTVDDYTLENPLTDGVSFSASGVSKTLSDSKDKFFATYTITNTSNAEIAVSEIGVIGCVAYGTSSGALYPTLMERTVIKPITIQPGSAGTVTFEISLEYDVN